VGEKRIVLTFWWWRGPAGKESPPADLLSRGSLDQKLLAENSASDKRGGGEDEEGGVGVSL